MQYVTGRVQDAYWYQIDIAYYTVKDREPTLRKNAFYIGLCYNSMQYPSCTMFTNIIFILFPKTYRVKKNMHLSFGVWQDEIADVLLQVVLSF
jgi:hypothetical protein